MAYNYEYPYFDAGDYNSDWLINKMKELEETVIGLETFKYIGENEILDLNQQKQNSIAAFTSNFNVLNSPVSNVQRVTVTYGSETAYIQQLYDLSNFTVYTRNYSAASGWTAWKLTQTFKYIGENEILDLNQQKQNSIAAFTSNFNVLNAPVSNVQRVTVTYGSETAYIQQLYDLSNFTVYARNYSTAIGWGAWKITQYESRNVIHAANIVQSGSLNTIKENIVTLVEGFNVSDCPTNNYGFLLVFGNSKTFDVIQLWYDRTTFFCYMRRSNNTGWEPWLELNHIDLTPYIKAVPHMKSGDNINTLEKNRTTLATQEVANIPSYAYFNILTIGPSDSNEQFQIAFQRDSNEIWLRPGNNGSWTNLTRNYTVLHRSIETQDLNAISGANYLSGYFSTPLSGYLYAQGVGIPGSSTDTYQIIMSSENRLFLRFRNNATWTNRVELQRVSATRSLTITSTAEDHSTDDEGRDRYMMGDNIYAESSKTMDNTYISLPGQSLLHSDEGKQSFKEAILSSDLSDTDVLMTNLEMWDMDIPLDTIAEEVTALSAAITAKNPMCELTLLSIPPIDIPLWGDELLDYTMPNGSTLRQVDDRLFKLSEEHAFTYVSFEYFYDAQNANLMEYLGEDFKTNKQYLRRIGSFIKNTM